jgi:hypothetical protein
MESDATDSGSLPGEDVFGGEYAGDIPLGPSA